MNLFDRLPGFQRSAPGLEQRVWRRLPAILLWGTLLPLLLATPQASDGASLLWNFRIFGFVVLHWTLVLTVGLACFIVRVMKGPAYVADAYPMPDDRPISVK